MKKTKSKISKTGSVQSGESSVQRRIMREAEDAVALYLETVSRKGIFKKSALYERPWFCICGAEKSGKTSLVSGCGITVPVKYPAGKNAVAVDGSDRIVWNFANEAVWIDIPGSFTHDNGHDQWLAFAEAMKKLRPDKAIDGMIVVVDCKKMIDKEVSDVKSMAQLLRVRADEYIALWGIEFPVSIVFTHCDAINGFSEYFSDSPDVLRKQVFGATLSSKQISLPAKLAFIDEFGLLVQSLNKSIIDKSNRQKNVSSRRLIYRFVHQFGSLQEKLGLFVTEYFAQTCYEGRPGFSGFYFTAASSVQSTGIESAYQTDTIGAGLTIANHPLNPHRSRFGVFEPPPAGIIKNEKISLFSRPLFSEIIPGNTLNTKTTRQRYRRDTMRQVVISGVIVLFTLLCCACFVTGFIESRKLINDTEEILSNTNAGNSSIESRYADFDVTGNCVAKLQKWRDHGAPLLSVVSGYYCGDKLLDKIQNGYFNMLHECITAPAVRYLEYELDECSRQSGELSGDEYKKMYRFLKTYLSISEAASSHPVDIDTSDMRPVLLDAVRRSLLSANENGEKLPKMVETILQSNCGLYLLYVKRQMLPPVQANQRLVSQTRMRLTSLPTAQNIYVSVVNRLSQNAATLSLDQILNRHGDGILKSNLTISTLYTQDGWDKQVAAVIDEASKNPFKLDWVIGAAGDVPYEKSDMQKLRSGMIDAYAADFRAQWLAFLSGVSMEQFGDCQRSGRLLQKLITDPSELSGLLAAISTYTTIKNESAADKLANAVSDAASKLIKDKTGAVADKIETAMLVGARHTSPFDEPLDVFEPLRAFARSGGGALSGFEGYKDKITTLCSQLQTLDNKGSDQALVVFSGKPDDALLSAWNYTHNVMTTMPKDIAAALHGILLLPIENTGIAASGFVAQALNVKWNSEIVKPFSKRFAGRYPFVAQGDDASFTEVMDFFRPHTGVFWGFYDRILDPYFVRNADGWVIRPVGSLSIPFHPDMIATLTNAERIRDIYFNADGTARVFSMTLTPMASNKTGIKLIVNGQKYDSISNGKPAIVNWPVESAQAGATLGVSVADDFTQDIGFTGMWGFLRLLEIAHINKTSDAGFMAKWQVAVQNMYVVTINCKVQVSGSDHPFAEQVFRKFRCPVDLVAGTLSKDRPAGGGSLSQ